MTEELRAVFFAAKAAMMRGGMAESDAEQMLVRLIDESFELIDELDAMDRADAAQVSEMLPEEYDLYMEIVHKMIEGGMELMKAVGLLCRYTIEVEKRKK